MKKGTISHAYKFIFTFIFSCLQLLVWSQDTSGGSKTITTETTTTTTTTEWYTQPWVWVAGGVLLLIIIVAMLRSRSTKEVTRTTVVRDDRS